MRFPQVLARSTSDAPLLDVGLALHSDVPSDTAARTLRAFLNAFAPRRSRFAVRVEASFVPPAPEDDDDNNNSHEPWSLVEVFHLEAPFALTEDVSLCSFVFWFAAFPDERGSFIEKPRQTCRVSRQHARGDRRQAATGQAHVLQQRLDFSSSPDFELERRPPRT